MSHSITLLGGSRAHTVETSNSKMLQNGHVAMACVWAKRSAFHKHKSGLCRMPLCSNLGTLCKAPDAVRASNAKSFASASSSCLCMLSSNIAVLKIRSCIV